MTAVGLFLTISLLCFATGEAEQDEGAAAVVTVWNHSGKPEERGALDTMFRDFNEAQDSITVDLVRLPEGSYNEQVSAAALSDDLPDLLDFDGPNLYNYAWAGHLIPLDDYVTEEMKDDLLPSIIKQGTYDDKLWAIGQFDSGLALWGNREYLEKAGVRIPTSLDEAWTFEEFNEALAKLKELPEVEYPLDLKLNYGQGEWYTYGFAPILWNFGAGLIDRDDFQSADGVLNGDQAVMAMEWFQEAFEKGYVNPDPAGDDDFYGKKIAALSFVGHWMYQPHKQGLGDDLVLIPMFNGPEDHTTGMGSWCWGITSSAESPVATWKFLKFLLSPNNILAITAENGAVPARKSALNRSAEYQEGGILSVFREQLNSIAVPRPQTPAYPTITSAFQQAVQNIIDGADVQEQLDKAVETIDQDIEDNQGYPTE